MDTANKPTHTQHFFDLNFTVVAEIEEYRINYKVYDIVGLVENPEKPGVYDVPHWQEKDSVSSPNPVDSLERAEIFMEGTVKWDGCSDWLPYAVQNCYMHSCDREGLVRVGEVMARCWDMTKTLCPNWDGV